MVSTDRIEGLETAMAIKAPVDAATTANITLSDAQTIDGVAVVADDRVLVKDQDTATEDGIYTVVAGAWTRASDWDGSRDAINGTLVTVKTGGTTNGNTIWRASATDNPYVIDTVSPTFVLAEYLIDVSGRVTYFFDSSTTVSEDPGDGDFRLNNATIASATVISFSDNTADSGNPDYSPYLITWDDSTQSALRGTITISELGAPEIFAIFSVNGAITDGTTYLDVPVAYVAGSGSFTASTKYVVSFVRTGDVGAAPAVQMKFDTDTDDADQGAGTVWLNNATVASATIVYLDDVEDAAGASINSWVDSFDDSTNTDLRGTITLTVKDDPAVFAIFNVTGTVTSASTYSKVAVTYVTGAGSFTAADKVVVGFTRTGDLGTGGGVRMVWDSDTDDADQGAGTVWVNNATVASATVVYLDDVEDAAGASINAWVDSFDDATATIQGTLTLTVATNPAVFAIFNVTGAVTSASTYSKVAVTYVTGAGSFTAADKVVVAFHRSGDDGAGSLSNVVEDTTPQLGGPLDVNGQSLGDGTRELLTFTEDASAVNHVNIENEATGSGPKLSAAGDDTNIDLNLNSKGTGGVLLNSVAPTQMKNLIINGDMRIAQRGTSFTSPANGSYTLDRITWNEVGPVVVDITQDTDVPDNAGFLNSLKVDITTADAAVANTDFTALVYRFEGFDTARLRIGSSSAVTATLSFWVKAVKTGTYCIALRNSALDRSYVADYTVSSASTWEFKTITIALDTSGTWIGATNGIGLYLSWTLSAGSDWHGTADTWEGAHDLATSSQANGTDSTDNNFWITGIQFEIGSVATAFEHRPFGAELVLCQRYYWKTFAYGTAPAQNAGILTGEVNFPATKGASTADNVSQKIIFPVLMRAAPTITTYNPAATNGEIRDIQASADCSSVGTGSLRDSGFYVKSTTSGSTSVGNLLGVHCQADAEL